MEITLSGSDEGAVDPIGDSQRLPGGSVATDLVKAGMTLETIPRGNDTSAEADRPDHGAGSDRYRWWRAGVRRVSTAPYQLWAWAITPVMVRQYVRIDQEGNVTSEAGWAYRLPIVKPDVTDPAIAAAVRAGAMGRVERLALVGTAPPAAVQPGD